MSKRARGARGRIAVAAAGVFCLTLCLALTGFLRVATDGALYYRIQTDEAVDAGISSEELSELDGYLADCLAGDGAAFRESDAFNEKEKAHMADVAALFDAARTVKWVSAVLTVLLLGCSLIPSGDRRRILRRGVWIGAAAFFLPLIAVGIWAAADFSSAFEAMHRLLFRNQLWRLSSKTDLLIRMLPERFFARIGTMAGLRAGILALASPAALLLATLPKVDVLFPKERTGE